MDFCHSGLAHLFTFAVAQHASQSLRRSLILDGKFTRFGNLMDRAHASFIERRFIVVLLMSEQSSFEPMAQPPHAVARDAFRIVLGYQVPVGPYLVDFTLVHPRVATRVAIELDGHEWHRRTAKEAEYEARRDRVVAAAGWTLVRFMGAEVMREPGRVAREAYERVRRALGPGVAATAGRTPAASTTERDPQCHSGSRIP